MLFRDGDISELPDMSCREISLVVDCRLVPIAFVLVLTEVPLKDPTCSVLPESEGYRTWFKTSQVFVIVNLPIIHICQKPMFNPFAIADVMVKNVCHKPLGVAG